MDIQSYLKQLNTKALLAGLGVNVFGSYASGIVLSTVVGAYFIFSGADIKTLSSMLYQHTGFMLTMLFITLGYCTISAYVTCKMAQRYFYLHSLAIGIISIVAMFLLDKLLMNLFPDEGYSKIPLWFNIIAYTGTIPACLLGGYIAKKRSAHIA